MLGSCNNITKRFNASQRGRILVLAAVVIFGILGSAWLLGMFSGLDNAPRTLVAPPGFMGPDHSAIVYNAQVDQVNLLDTNAAARRASIRRVRLMHTSDRSTRNMLPCLLHVCGLLVTGSTACVDMLQQARLGPR